MISRWKVSYLLECQNISVYKHTKLCGPSRPIIVADTALNYASQFDQRTDLEGDIKGTMHHDEITLNKSILYE